MFLNNKSIWLFIKNHDFHGNPLYKFKDWEHSYKHIHISAASDPRAHNLLSNESAEISLFHDDQIFKLSNMNIYFLMRSVEINEKSWKNKGVIHIYL